jgi:uncharacterized protein (TIGR02246 family)
MKIGVALIAVLSLVLLASRGNGEQAAPPPVEEQILKLEAVWNQAHLRGDADALDRLWAPNITVIIPEMQPFSKEDLLKMWRSMKVTFTRYETSDVRVQSSGGTAVVTGRLQRSRDFGGRAKDEDWLFTKTYARVDGEWLVVAYHASVTPSP